MVYTRHGDVQTWSVATGIRLEASQGSAPFADAEARCAQKPESIMK